MLQRERRNLRSNRVELKEATMFGPLKVTLESPAAVQSPRAGVRAGLIGMWKLRAIERLPGVGPVDGGEAGGRAYIIFTPRGRFMSLVEGDHNLSETDASAVSVFRATFAYTGAYRVEGDAWITRVDRSWTDASVADEHTRFFDLDGDRLTVMPVFKPRGSGGGTISNSAFIFERMKG
jgi:hypothetical protein